MAVKLERYDPRYNILADLCCDKIEDLLETLQVDLENSGNKYIGCCPIHGDSDNPNALNIYPDGYSIRGYWKCRTKGCEARRNKQGNIMFGRTIIGFIRGCLSNLKLRYHWKYRPDKVYPFRDTIDWICNFLKVNLNNIKVDEKELERRRFIRECIEAEADNAQIYNGKKIHRKVVRNSLIIPAEYFINRGYSREILDKYDVGTAKKSKLETTDRVIVPIYNEEEYLIGYTCRSIYEKCDNCKLYHNHLMKCPTGSEVNLYSKWRHVNFSPEKTLYNFWAASRYIKESNTSVIVEGPADCWRLEENGIHNCVAIFGKELLDGQEKLLAKSQTMSLIIALDNDEAGREGCRMIKEKYGRLYRTYFPKFSEKDIGELGEDAITNSIRPYLSSVNYL